MISSRFSTLLKHCNFCLYTLITWNINFLHLNTMMFLLAAYNLEYKFLLKALNSCFILRVVVHTWFVYFSTDICRDHGPPPLPPVREAWLETVVSEFSYPPSVFLMAPSSLSHGFFRFVLAPFSSLFYLSFSDWICYCLERLLTHLKCALFSKKPIV